MITWHNLFSQEFQYQLLFVSSHCVVLALSLLVCLYSFGSIAFSSVLLALYFSPCIAFSSLLLYLCSFLCLTLSVIFLCFSHIIASSCPCFLYNFVYFSLVLCIYSICNLLCYCMLFDVSYFGGITFDMFQFVPCCLRCILWFLPLITLSKPLWRSLLFSRSFFSSSSLFWRG